MVIIRQNNLQESMMLKISVRICPSFWYQMALFRVLAHGLLFFLVDSNSPCKDLLFPRGPNLAQKPLYLVGTVLNTQSKFCLMRFAPLTRELYMWSSVVGTFLRLRLFRPLNPTLT